MNPPRRSRPRGRSMARGHTGVMDEDTSTKPRRAQGLVVLGVARQDQRFAAGPVRQGRRRHVEVEQVVRDSRRPQRRVQQARRRSWFRT